jgi:hypothetical protein
MGEIKRKQDGQDVQGFGSPSRLKNKGLLFILRRNSMQGRLQTRNLMQGRLLWIHRMNSKQGRLMWIQRTWVHTMQRRVLCIL